MNREEEIAERFSRDIARHVMEIQNDNGLYRHLRFQRPETRDCYFDLITWPGYLTIAGDMGTFTFSRTRDMFEFFGDGEHGISPGYWQEKIQAGAGPEGSRAITTEWDSEAHHRNVVQEWKEWLEGNALPDPETTGEVKEYLRDNLLNCNDEYEAIAAVREFDCPEAPGLLEDFWEYSDSRYQFHYLWCCHAIVWGIKQYRQREEQETA